MIEAVDMLESKQLASKLKFWLPRRLPSRVRLVVSVTKSNIDAMEFFRSASVRLEPCPEMEEQLVTIKNQLLDDKDSNELRISKFVDHLQYEINLKRLKLKVYLLRVMISLYYKDSQIVDMLSRP